MKNKLSIIGDFNPESETHKATNDAIGHSLNKLGVDLKADRISTEDISKSVLKNSQGIWMVPGSPYKNMGNAITAIKFARENGVPFLGTCGGFQHIIIEYARNLLGMVDAGHAEYDPNASEPTISALTCSLAGKEFKLNLRDGSRSALLYGQLQVSERYYCNFGINPDYMEDIRSGPIKITGEDHDGEIRVVEYDEHPFFIGTLYVPQIKSTSINPHPIVTGFFEAVSKT